MYSSGPNLLLPAGFILAEVSYPRVSINRLFFYLILENPRLVVSRWGDRTIHEMDISLIVLSPYRTRWPPLSYCYLFLFFMQFSFHPFFSTQDRAI